MSQSELPARLRKLSEVAGSRRALARISGLSDATLKNWEDGMQPQESKLRDFLRSTGVAREWLVEGQGDEHEQLAQLSNMIEAAPSPREKLSRALLRTGMSPEELAKRMGYDSGVINAVVNGTARASERMIEAIVRHVPVLTKEDLMGGSDDALIISETGSEGTYGAKPNIIVPQGDTVRYVPEISWAQAGTMKDLSFLDEAYDFRGVAAINIRDRRAFAVAIEGDSMSPEIRPGDKAIVTPSTAPQVGDTVIVQTLDGRVMCKIYRTKLGGQFVVLESLNSAYKPVEIPREEIVWIYPVAQVTKNLKRN